MRHILNFPCSILVSITSLVVIHLVGSLLLCLKISTHMFRGWKGYLSLDLKVVKAMQIEGFLVCPTVCSYLLGHMMKCLPRYFLWVARMR